MSWLELTAWTWFGIAIGVLLLLPVPMIYENVMKKEKNAKRHT